MGRSSHQPTSAVEATGPESEASDHALNATDFASAVTAITSAFGDPTRRGIYLYVHQHADGVTATEVAEHFDLHPNVARHHLDKLVGGGYLEVALDRGHHGGAGRPSKRYAPTSADMQLEVRVRHDDVLISLLGRALARLPAEEAEAMAEEVGVEYGRLMAQSMGLADGQRSFRTALHSVADALTAHGFAAHTERRENALRIVSEHCPFGDAATENPVICAVDRGLVKGMLDELYGGTEPELHSSVARGDASCITVVGR